MADGWSSGTAPRQPVRRISTDDGGVMRIARDFRVGRRMGRVARRRPAQELRIRNETWRALMQHERAVRQVVHRRHVMPLAARGRVDALRVELGVDGVGTGSVRMDRAPDPTKRT